jgi:hypothetical protein
MPAPKFLYRSPSVVALSDTLTAAAVFVIVLSAHALSTNATPFDSRWTVPTSVSILRQGNTDLDEYLPLLERDSFYGIECISATGARVFPVRSVTDCPGGRFYNFYPVAVSALVTPIVFALESGVAAAQSLLAPIAARTPGSVRRAFLQGDLVGGSAIVELIIASLIVAVASVVMLFVAREFLPLSQSFLVAMVFAFCTSAWSTGSRALWQHGPSMMMLSLGILLLLRAARGVRSIAALGVVVALAFYIRPTNAVAVAAISVFVLVYHRKHFPLYLAGMALVSLGFTAYNIAVYGNLLAPYSLVRRGAAGGLALHSAFLEALAGHLVSPARGLLVFTPLFLLAIGGMFLTPPGETARRMRPFLIAMLIGHWLLISSFEQWSGGHCYGPRYFSDMTPVFVWFLIPVLLRAGRRGFAASFAILAAVSFFIHYEGATQWSCMLWNVSPVNVDSHPERIWDWKDPQFLRGIR